MSACDRSPRRASGLRVEADEVIRKLREHTPELVAALKRAARQGSKAARRMLIERRDLVMKVDRA